MGHGKPFQNQKPFNLGLTNISATTSSRSLPQSGLFWLPKTTIWSHVWRVDTVQCACSARMVSEELSFTAVQSKNQNQCLTFVLWTRWEKIGFGEFSGLEVEVLVYNVGLYVKQNIPRIKSSLAEFFAFYASPALSEGEGGSRLPCYVFCTCRLT